ncbi:MAG: heavy-metal-associated domain-containing protein [Cocleimonas sp.]|nr:heavy-metal-associated domain-containing protein [Cocleimonas sp.]
MKTQFKVEKMMCGGCSANVEKVLADVAGVDSIDVNLEEKTVTIKGDIDTGVVAMVITEAGYPATLT